MTTPAPQQFELTLEQRQLLGKVYLMILGWRQERERKQAKQMDQSAENDVEGNQILLAETAVPVRQGA